MNCIKQLCFFLFFLLSTLKISATGQVPDYLIQGKDTLAIHANPLEPYFKKNPIKDGLITSFNTANWRGYIAYFKIENNKLVVHDLYKEEYREDGKGSTQRKLISIYSDVFGEIKDFECNFYNGVLICPYGKLINYVHMGYSSTYENYHLIEINQGNFIKEVKVTAEEFTQLKFKHFEKFKQTEEYKKMLEETINLVKESDKHIQSEFKDLEKEEKKRKKQNKYLYEKEKEMERLKSAENFIFIFTTDNIKTIDIPN